MIISLMRSAEPRSRLYAFRLASRRAPSFMTYLPSTGALLSVCNEVAHSLPKTPPPRLAQTLTYLKLRLYYSLVSYLDVYTTTPLNLALRLVSLVVASTSLQGDRFTMYRSV